MTVYNNVLSGTWPGETWSMTVHTEKVGGSLAAAATAFATAAGVLWTTGGAAGLAPYIGTTVSAVEVSTAELSPVTGKQLGRTIAAFVHAGTSVSALLPPQCAVVGSMRTALATRAGRGRFYMPPMASNVLAAGLIDGTVQTELATVIKEFLQSLATSTYPAVIYHRASRLTDAVISCDVGNVFDTQRRRRSKLVETRVSNAL